MQVFSQTLPAMNQNAAASQSGAQASGPVFGAEAEKNTLNNLIEANGEHATVPGAPANAMFSNSPIMTTMEMKAGPNALIGNAFENNAGETVYLKGFKDTTEQDTAEQNTKTVDILRGNPGSANKSEGISFGGNTKVVELTKIFSPETPEETSAPAASASSNPMEEVLKFLVSLLASLFGGSDSGSGTNNNANTQAETNSNNIS